MNSTVKKRSIVIGCHETSISLEDGFWTSLQQIARGRQVTRSDLIASLDARSRTAISRPQFGSSFSTVIARWPWRTRNAIVRPIYTRQAVLEYSKVDGASLAPPPGCRAAIFTPSN